MRKAAAAIATAAILVVGIRYTMSGDEFGFYLSLIGL